MIKENKYLSLVLYENSQRFSFIKENFELMRVTKILFKD